MAEEFYLVPKSQYEELMPDKPPPQESVHIKAPPPGLPQQSLPSEKFQIGGGANSNFAFDDSDMSESESVDSAALNEKLEEDWKQRWKTL